MAPSDDLREALEATIEGDVVYLGPGEYEIQPSDPYMHADNVTIKGAGDDTVLRVPDDYGDFFSVFGGQATSDTFLRGLTLKNFKLDLNPAGYGGTPDGGDACAGAIIAWKNADCTVDNLTIIYGSVDCVDFNAPADESYNAVIQNCRMLFVRATGAPDYDSSAIYVEGYNHVIRNNWLTSDPANRFFASTGIETHGGIFVKLIERNSTIPTKNTQIFTTVSDNQSTVEINVLQGEREIAKENKSLGKFQLVGIPPAARGVPQIEVAFAIDSSVIVNVSARDMATGRAQGMQINPAGGLSQTEIDRIVSEADANKAIDLKRRELRQMKNKLEGLITGNDRIFREFGKLLEGDENDRVGRTLAHAKETLTSEERGDIDNALVDMQGVSRLLTNAMLYKDKGGKGS
ncbi:MAG: Hsp70 family protein [Planctomycetota bacterium]